MNSWSQAQAAMFHCNWYSAYQLGHTTQRIPEESTYHQQLCPTASPVKQTGSKLVMLDTSASVIYLKEVAVPLSPHTDQVYLSYTEVK